MKIFTDIRVADVHFPGHPEGPWRVSRCIDYFENAGRPMNLPPIKATDQDLLRVHTPAHISAFRSGLFDDPDTFFDPLLAETVMISCSGAISAMESALNGVPAFSLMRPPGHHAGREKIAGFCYVNNMAVAMARAVAKKKKIAILDIDVHHGDGTEDIAFQRPDWLYVSLHQSPLYPGTGTSNRENCLNFLLPPLTDENAYLPILEKGIKKITAFKPDLLGVSMGFDTFKKCPLAQLKLEISSYKKMGLLIAKTGLPRFGILEGGYTQELPQCLDEFLLGFET